MDEELIVKYIRTKNKIRKITTYKENGELRRYHETVASYLRKNVSNSIFAKAYVPRSSIFKNARAHLYNDVFLKMDIKNFFPSLNHEYLSEKLYYEVNKNTSISRKECYDIIRRCSTSERGLPLGLVTSPSLANLYMKEFDGLLYGQIKKMGLKNPIYTRYADDMVISFQHGKSDEKNVELIQTEVEKLLKRIHLKLNKNKTKVVDLGKSNHVRITGVSITKDVNNYRHISVGRKTKNTLFWKAINLYDQEEKDYLQIAHLKGMYSFVLSVEKKNVEACYSAKMKELIKERGFDSLKELIQDLG